MSEGGRRSTLHELRNAWGTGARPLLHAKAACGRLRTIGDISFWCRPPGDTGMVKCPGDYQHGCSSRPGGRPAVVNCSDFLVATMSETGYRIMYQRLTRLRARRFRGRRKACTRGASLDHITRPRLRKREVLDGSASEPVRWIVAERAAWSGCRGPDYDPLDSRRCRSDRPA